jgi:hypothetical protein
MEATEVMSELDEKSLTNALVKCMSVRDVKIIAEQSSKDGALLRLIVCLALDGNNTRAAKAAWVLSRTAEVFKTDINSFANNIVDRLLEPASSGIKRELLKALLFSNIHSDEDTRLFDILLTIPFSADDVGVKYMALRHFEKYSLNHTELNQEIITTLELSISANPALWAKHAQKLIDRINKKTKRKSKK